MSNARLQQCITLVLAALALAWVLGCWASDALRLSAWALLLLVPHAPVLAFETAWAAWAARRDAARRPMGQGHGPAQAYPGWGVWVGSWLREVKVSVLTFGWRQPWAHRRWPDFLPEHASGQRGVLLVHGFVCNRGFWNPWMPRLRAAGVPHVAVSLGPPFADIAVQAQGLQAAWQRLMDATGVPPLLVGHSMGGLVIRHWLSLQTEERALAHEVITIGSPHHGTALAAMARSPAAAQMQLLSPFLVALAAGETAARRAQVTCYWSVCDNIVFPANTATLPGARAVAVHGVAHVSLAHAPQILQDVLARTAPSAPPR